MICLLVLTHLKVITCFILKPWKLIFDFNFYSTGIKNSYKNTEMNAALRKLSRKILTKIIWKYFKHETLFS